MGRTRTYRNVTLVEKSYLNAATDSKLEFSGMQEEKKDFGLVVLANYKATIKRKHWQKVLVYD